MELGLGVRVPDGLGHGRGVGASAAFACHRRASRCSAACHGCFHGGPICTCHPLLGTASDAPAIARQRGVKAVDNADFLIRAFLGSRKFNQSTSGCTRGNDGECLGNCVKQRCACSPIVG